MLVKEAPGGDGVIAHTTHVLGDVLGDTPADTDTVFVFMTQPR